MKFYRRFLTSCYIQTSTRNERYEGALLEAAQSRGKLKLNVLKCNSETRKGLSLTLPPPSSSSVNLATGMSVWVRRGRRERKRMTWKGEVDWKWARVCGWSGAGFMKSERKLMAAREGCWSNGLGSISFTLGHTRLALLTLQHPPHACEVHVFQTTPVQPQKSYLSLPVALEYDILYLTCDA